MPITRSQAIEIANRELASPSAARIDVHVLAEATQEFDVGWVFYYQSARYLETRDISDMLVGTAPLFVARSDGKSFFVSYHRSIDESMAAYRACGNPNASETPEVRLVGWRPGAIAVSAIQILRRHAALGLAEAKRTIDSCLADESPIVRTTDVKTARALVAGLAAVGFDALVSYS